MDVIIRWSTVPRRRAAVAACRYAPAGARSFGPMTAGTRFGGAYGSTANAEVACIPMIESRQAVEQIDDILAVPGIDAIYIGPADLSLTYGLAPGLDNPDEVFQSALTRVVDSCRRHNVIAGIHASAALAQRRHDGGFRLITVGFDFQPIVAALRSDLVTARKKKPARPERPLAPSGLTVHIMAQRDVHL